jgi:hypothetical protein
VQNHEFHQIGAKIPNKQKRCKKLPLQKQRHARALPAAASAKLALKISIFRLAFSPVQTID